MQTQNGCKEKHAKDYCTITSNAHTAEEGPCPASLLTIQFLYRPTSGQGTNGGPPGGSEDHTHGSDN